MSHFFASKAFKIILAIALAVTIFSFLLRFSIIRPHDFLAGLTASVVPTSAPDKLSALPTIFKSVYATGWSAGAPGYQRYLDYMFKTTTVNAVVIDVKDASGVVSYRTQAPLVKKYQAYWPEIRNLDALIEKLHSQGIYVIGRIAVFEDGQLVKARPDLAVYDIAKTTDTNQPVLWGNASGLAWVDPASQEVWDYNLEIARDALSHGFDEINFDYVRFPTDGNLKNMGFPKWDKKTTRASVIKNFFAYTRNTLPNATLSADLFGLTTVNTDDLGIGQVFENALEYFDYVCPMVYPSHFANGFLGFENPADHPYEVIKYSIDRAVIKKQRYYNAKVKTMGIGAEPPKLAKIRPWIQDFNLGAIYDAPMITQQINAVADATGSDYVGFMVWSPSNIYNQEALPKSKIAGY